ncbi:hypothetical protein [Kitasatospora cinereorecta]|uniref:hypothetical protein n=1 Tax=Kitasatospora cinereorecta TaxID=285560 RepID=UPI0031F95ADC
MSPQHQPALRIAGALLASTAALAALPTSVAHAAPGDNGDVKVHDSTTAQDNQRDDPKVCQFYLDAFNFDTVQSVAWTVSQQPPTGNGLALAGAIVLTGGTGRTATYSLPAGHYKLEWTFTGENGNAKQKVFMVDCASSSPSSTPSGPPTGGSPSGRGSSPAAVPGHGHGPSGGVAAGGGGSVHGPEVAEIAAGSLLTAVAVWLGLRAARRRSARNAAS